VKKTPPTVSLVKLTELIHHNVHVPPDIMLKVLTVPLVHGKVSLVTLPLIVPLVKMKTTELSILVTVLMDGITLTHKLTVTNVKPDVPPVTKKTCV
jgi:hypothetical protein